uniref:Uncharacterized protein n=1 Tax=Glossina austeni TaxID=7395 RepID=A0A1A9VDX7_GLOAU
MYFYACACKHFGLLLGYSCALGHILRFLTMKNIIAFVCIAKGKTDFGLGNDEQCTRDYCSQIVDSSPLFLIDGNISSILKISCIASDGDDDDGVVVADPFIGRLLSWFADFLRNNFAMNN